MKDAISRQDAIKAVQDMHLSQASQACRLIQNLKKLPSKNISPLYKGTNGEVIKSLFPNGRVLNKDECIGFEIIFDDGTSYCSFFDGIWWNSPYEPQEAR